MTSKNITKKLKEDIRQEKEHYRVECLSCKSELERSGWGGSREMWRIAREIILEAVDRDGTFLDIGCANGILVRDLRKWARESKGINLIPYGIDFIEEFIEESKGNNPGFEKNFMLADIMEFNPTEKFTFIRAEFYGPHKDFDAFIKKYLNMLEPDGRLILTFYDSQKDLFNLIDEVIRKKGSKLGYYFAGSSEIPKTTHIFWLKKISKN